jgi:hypothetical protein
MDENQARAMNILRGLPGRWCGNGVVEFPTIPAYEYREELEFAANEVQPVLRYEQRTWKKLESGEFAPSHWECGFFRLLSGTEIEFLSAQAGGRVEVSRGVLSPTGDGFILRLESRIVAGDPRTGETEREFVLQGEVLRYRMQMSTTSVPRLTQHTHAELAPCD